MFQAIRKMISLIAKHLCCNRGEVDLRRFGMGKSGNTPLETKIKSCEQEGVSLTTDKTICEATYRTLSGICYFETVITLSKYEIGIF